MAKRLDAGPTASPSPLLPSCASRKFMPYWNHASAPYSCRLLPAGGTVGREQSINDFPVLSNSSVEGLRFFFFSVAAAFTLGFVAREIRSEYAYRRANRRGRKLRVSKSLQHKQMSGYPPLEGPSKLAPVRARNIFHTTVLISSAPVVGVVPWSKSSAQPSLAAAE